MARERPTASNVSRPALMGLDGGQSASEMPRSTRAEAHALRRRALQTHARLQEHFDLLIESNARHVRGATDPDSLHADCIHTVYRSTTGNWANEAGPGKRIYGVHATKQESVRLGQVLARAAQTHHVIHDTDGTISSLDAYGDEAASQRG